MSQKPRARRRAIVTMSALAIIASLQALPRFVPDTSRGQGAGGRPESTGAPPEARLGYRGREPMGRAVAFVWPRTGGSRQKWRAVGRILKFFERDFFHVHVGFGSRAVGQKFADDVVFPIGVENSAGEFAIEEIKRLREVILNGVAVSAVVELGELG